MIVVTVKNGQAFNRVNRIAVKLPDAVSKSGFEFTKAVQRNMRLELTRQGLLWGRRLWNSIKARQVSKNQSEVSMVNYGFFLDSMRPHYVKLKRGRNIRRWAFEKGNANVQEIAKRQGSVYVKPHPWIDNAYSRSLLSLRRIVQQNVRQSMQRGA